MGKKPSSGSSKPKKNKKGGRKFGPDAVAMKLQAAPKTNPFETIWSRRKFDILGKKRKGEERNIAQSRSKAIEKRKKTLLKEYEQSQKSSVFLDKRIGEGDEDLEEFDKGIMRSQRERQMKSSKKSKYNLSDGEEEELEIQEGFFPERDDYEEDFRFDEDDDGGSGKKTAFSGWPNHSNEEDSEQAGHEARPKSKKEVMEEVMAKSKFFKAEKAKEKEETMELAEQLDKDFTLLVQSQALQSLTQPNKLHALRALVNHPSLNSGVKKLEKPSIENKTASQHDKPDFYDQLVSEMALDRRARPSDRTKTAEEIAQEEKERLEELEEQRQKRMVAADGSSDDEADGSDDDDASFKRVRSLSGDDLGDSFSNGEELPDKTTWNDLKRKAEDDGDDDSEDDASDEESEGSEEDEEEEGTDENDENDKVQLLKDWEQSDDELDTDLEDDEDDDQLDSEKKEVGKKGSEKKEAGVVANIKETSKRSGAPDNELPYTIEAPKSLEEFTSLIENRPDDQIVEAIRRIRAFNAINVAAENKRKMQIFYGVLLQYFAVMANKKPVKLKLLNVLVKPLIEMSSEIPYFSAICARHRLLKTRTQFSEDSKISGKNGWPSLKTVFLLRLWSMIFPCSDFRHAVMTPAMLLICEYLTRCPITSGRDIVIGSFLCSLMLSITKQSQKYCPEALLFIQATFTSAFEKTEESFVQNQLNHLLEIKVSKPLLCIKSEVKEINSVNFLTLMDLPEDSPHFSSDNFRASILTALTETLKGFVYVYEGLNAFPEIFLPVSKLLSKLADKDHMPEMLQNNLRDVTKLIEQKADEHHVLRQPLQMRKKKPVPIKLLNPKFEEGFIKGRDYDPDRQRAETKKLKKLLKKEEKGARVELRKDNHFLYHVKEKDRMLAEEERAEKYGKARAFLQEQESAFKSGQLGKGKKRRR